MKRLSNFRALLLGAPGSGKGTYGQLLRKTFDLEYVCSGDLIREEMYSGSKLGASMQEQYMRGDILPPDVVLPLLKNKLFNNKDSNASRVLLDGFPRSLEQARTLDKYFAEEGSTGIDLVVNLQLPDNVIIEKLVNRWMCNRCGANYNTAHIVDPQQGINMPAMAPKISGYCDHCPDEALTQRKDDKRDIIEARLKTHHKLSGPLLEYYTNKSTSTHTQPILLQMDVCDGKDGAWPRLKKHVEDIIEKHDQ